MIARTISNNRSIKNKKVTRDGVKWKKVRIDDKAGTCENN